MAILEVMTDESEIDGCGGERFKSFEDDSLWGRISDLLACRR